MEQQEVRAVLGLLISCWYSNLNNFSQQVAELEQQSRERVNQHAALYTRRLRRHRRRRRRRARDLEMLELMLLRRRARICSRTMWAQPRSCSWWQHVSDNWNDRDWQLNFRMRRTTFMQLCDVLRPSLARRVTRRPVPVELRVAVCLWKLATNLELRSISRLFGVGISTACVIVQEVVTAINRVMQPDYIQAPTEAELRGIIQGFRDKWGFPQVAGAIGTTHIGILAPVEYPEDYYNNKGFYSVLLQGVVDHNLKFWDINVGCPGTLRDARVLANSGLCHRAENGTLLPHWTETIDGVDVPPLLLGDAAYPLLPWLMTPFPEGAGATQTQTMFSHRLGQARMPVQKAFCRLKGRWRCLLKRCDAHISLVSHIIAACCVLHNFCEVNNEEWEEEETGIDEAGSGGVVREKNLQANHGDDVRNALCAYFTSCGLRSDNLSLKVSHFQ